MKEENKDGDDPEIGAIQGPDIIREELTRAATLLDDGKYARLISRNMQRLGSWAAECKRKKGETLSSSPESIETPVSEIPMTSTSKTKSKPKLAFKRVQDEKKSVNSDVKHSQHETDSITTGSSVSQSQDVNELMALSASQPEEYSQEIDSRGRRERIVPHGKSGGRRENCKIQRKIIIGEISADVLKQVHSQVVGRSIPRRRWRGRMGRQVWKLRKKSTRQSERALHTINETAILSKVGQALFNRSSDRLYSGEQRRDRNILRLPRRVLDANERAAIKPTVARTKQ